MNISEDSLTAGGLVTRAYELRHDARGRLTSELRITPEDNPRYLPGDGPRKVTFGYDNANNPISMTCE